MNGAIALRASTCNKPDDELSEPVNAPLAMSLGELFAAVDRVLKAKRASPPYMTWWRVRSMWMEPSRRFVRFLRSVPVPDGVISVARDAEPWQILSVFARTVRTGQTAAS